MWAEGPIVASVGAGFTVPGLFTVINVLEVHQLAKSNTIIVLWKIAVPVVGSGMFIELGKGSTR